MCRRRAWSGAAGAAQGAHRVQGHLPQPRLLPGRVHAAVLPYRWRARPVQGNSGLVRFIKYCLVSTRKLGLHSLQCAVPVWACRLLMGKADVPESA